MSTEILKLVNGDIAREARLKAKPKYVEFEHAVFKVNYKIDTKLADLLDTDAYFVATMRGDIMDLYEKLVGEFADRWAKADHVASKEPLSKVELGDLHADVEKLFATYRKSVKQTADDHVKRWQQIRKDRTKYTHEVTFDVLVGTASLVGGGFSAVTGLATLGVSFVTGLIGVVKGLAALWLEYKRVAADVDAAHARVTQTIAELLKAYENVSDASVGRREVGKSAVADFFVVRMATIKLADTEFVTYKGKVAPMHEHTAELGRALNSLLDKQTQLDRKVAAELAVAMKKEHRHSDKFDRFMGAMEHSRIEVQKLIAAIGEMHPILRKHEDFTKKLTADLAELHARKPTWARNMEWVVKGGSILLSPTVTAIATHGDNLKRLAETLDTCYDAFVNEVVA